MAKGLTARRVLMLASVALLAFPASAAAHGDIASTSPEADSTIRRRIDHVLINLTQAPVEDKTFVRVFDGCEDQLVDEVFVSDRTVHVFLSKKGARGDWLVQYRFVSADDGHRTIGEFGFTVSGEPDCEEEEPAESEEPSAEGDSDTDADADEAGADEAGADEAAAAEPETEPASDEGSFPAVPVGLGIIALAVVAVAVKVTGSRR